MAEFQTGIATVVHSDMRSITVRCPFAPHHHDHPRAMLGSRAVLSGCHAGYTRCRAYSIPSPSAKKHRPR